MMKDIKIGAKLLTSYLIIALVSTCMPDESIISTVRALELPGNHDQTVSTRCDT